MYSVHLRKGDSKLPTTTFDHFLKIHQCQCSCLKQLHVIDYAPISSTNWNRIWRHSGFLFGSNSGNVYFHCKLEWQNHRTMWTCPLLAVSFLLIYSEWIWQFILKTFCYKEYINSSSMHLAIHPIHISYYFCTLNYKDEWKTSPSFKENMKQLRHSKCKWIEVAKVDGS